MTLLGDVVTRQKTHGQPSVGVARRAQSPRVALRSWSMLTPFGDSRATWNALLCGNSIEDHARCDDVPGNCRASQLARRVAHETASHGVDDNAAVIVGTSKGSVEDWLGGAVSTAAELVRRMGWTRLKVVKEEARGVVSSFTSISSSSRARVNRSRPTRSDPSS